MAPTTITTTSELTTAEARQFGADFAAAHPELPPIGIGEVCRSEWLASGRVPWAGRVAGMAAGAARTRAAHPVTFVPKARRTDVTATCRHCAFAVTGPVDVTRQQVEDHEVDEHWR